MKHTKQCNPNELDTTQCRNALEEMQVTFPRGSRLPELRELLRQALASQGKRSADRTTSGD